MMRIVLICNMAILLFAVGCGGPRPLDEWTDVFLSTADMGVPDNVANAIRASDKASQASLSCAAMFTAVEALQEVRMLAWRDARIFPSAQSFDIVSAANYATMKSPEVCFDAEDIRKRAFGDSPFTREAPK